MLLLTLFFLFSVVAVAGVLAVGSYNKLNVALEHVKLSRSSIKIAIDKRCTAVNDLVQLTMHFQAREELMVLKISQDTSASGMAVAYQQSAMLLNNIQNVANRFPDLKADVHFTRIMDNVQNCESEIQQQRHWSNQAVLAFNTLQTAFPHVVVARLAGFNREEYVDLDVSDARSRAQPMRIAQPQGADAQLSHVLGLGAPPVSQASVAPMLPRHQAPPMSLAPARGGGTAVVGALPNVSLRFLSGPLGGRNVPIGAGAVLGREANAAQIVVADAQVSSAHAWIGMGDQGLVFVDRGSTNGSMVNQVQVRPGEPVAVKAGDVISLGRANPVSFVIDQS
jgi:hypothetical protein